MDFSVSSQIYNPAPTLQDLLRNLQISIDHDLSKRKISSQIDQALGFNIKKIEETMRTKALQINPDTLFDEWGPMLHNGAQTWVGLDFQILQSTYHDLKIIFETIKPKPNQKIIDLGAGYGRMGLFLHWYYPLCQFLGIELVRERVIEANRIYKKFELYRKEMMVGDLFELAELPTGDFYFIYDFGSEKHIQKILNQLRELKGNIFIVKGQICHNLMKKDPFWGEGFKVKKLDDVHLYFL
jgi:SAM-dependent methyltransferase